MVPCTTTLPAGCPTYEPGRPYRYALEVNAGALAKWHADSNARLLMGDLRRRPAAGR